MKRKNLKGDELKVYNYQHTKQRAKERYNLQLSKSNYNQLCQQIKNRSLVVQIKKEVQKRGTQRVFKVRFRDCNLYAVYLDETETITTLLPPNDF